MTITNEITSPRISGELSLVSLGLDGLVVLVVLVVLLGFSC